MAQGGQRLGLRPEAAADLGIDRERRRELLDRHCSFELTVRGGEHHTHRAATELVADLVARKCLRDLCGQYPAHPCASSETGARSELASRGAYPRQAMGFALL